jgi:hypothetical protein
MLGPSVGVPFTTAVFLDSTEVGVSCSTCVLAVEAVTTPVLLTLALLEALEAVMFALHPFG